MDRYRTVSCAAGLWIVGTLTGCANTQLKTVWIDPQFQGPLSKVLVVGVSKEPANRRVFEDEFCARIKEKGVTAVPSYTIFSSPEDMLDENTVLDQLKRRGVGSVLVTRLIDSKTVRQYYPPEREYDVPRPYYRGWHGYYRTGYERVTRPGYVTEYEVLTLETNVYAVDGEKLIYSAISETTVDSTSEAELRAFVDTMVANMSAEGLFRPPAKDHPSAEPDSDESG
jgi:hypothetical protein